MKCKGILALFLAKLMHSKSEFLCCPACEILSNGMCFLAVYGAQPPQATDVVDEGALHRGREVTGSAARGRWQVPHH